MTTIAPTARVHFTPTAFVDAPFDRDGQVLRLAGGMLWFAAFDVLAVDDGRRTFDSLVPVGGLDDFIESLSPAQQAAARQTIARIVAPRPPLLLGERTVRLDQPQVMAILNITPDSFSDGGKHDGDPARAAAIGVQMAADGAAIIDVGGESTRPGAPLVWEGDEIERIRPVIERLAGCGVAVSLDTRKAGVMEAGLAAGARMINDVSALTWDARSAEVLRASDCPIVLMHHQGSPQSMQDRPTYDDVLVDVYDWLEDRIAAAEAAGIARSRLIVDPGIGFGKSVRHNLALLNGLALFHGLGCPVLLGASRKRLIGALSNEAPVEQRLGGSVALALHGAARGAQIVRVHDVPETMQALRVWRGMRDEALIPQR